MIVSQEWAEYASRVGIPDSSLPSNVHEVVALRKALTSFEGEIQANLQSLYPDAVHCLTVTTQWIPARDGHRIRCLVYKPDGDGPFPVYVYTHGGGWVVGRPETDDISNRRLCNRVKVVIISIDYRLAPENPYPIPINDCEDALDWTYKNATRFAGDVQPGIVLGGFSAGGQLAACLAIRARARKLAVPVSGLILRCPWLADWQALSPRLRASLKSIDECAKAPHVDSEGLYLMRKWFDVPDSKSGSSDIFPLHVDDDRAARLPPVFIQVSGADPLRDEGIAFYDILQRNGVPSKLIHYEGMPHGFHTHEIPTAKKAETDMREGFNWILNESSKLKKIGRPKL